MLMEFLQNMDMFVYTFLPTTMSLMQQKQFGPLLKTGWLQGM